MLAVIYDCLRFLWMTLALNFLSGHFSQVLCDLKKLGIKTHIHVFRLSPKLTSQQLHFTFRIFVNMVSEPFYKPV